MSKLEPTRTHSNPTATDELRRLLDERGVEWHDTKIGKGFITVFEHDGITWIVTEHSSGRLSVKGCVKPTQGHYDGMTPEQAIAATLGDADATAVRQGVAGTCHDEGDPGDFCCSACGVRMFTDTSDTYTMIASDGYTIIKHPNYCPNCGRRIEQ